jgi:hypothetical protein
VVAPASRGIVVCFAALAAPSGGKTMKKLFRLSLAACAAALCAAAAQAEVLEFTAHLTTSQEVPPTGTDAHGLALLFYDDQGTASLLDDTMSLTLSVFDLSGPATGMHIHGAAAPGQNAPVRVDLSLSPFVHFNSGGTLLLGGDAVPVPMVPETPPSATNPGYPAMSFLDMLNGGLAYVNVHTPNFPAGEVRGQFLSVTSPVPEPGSYALMLAGIGALLLWHARGRSRREG